MKATLPLFAFIAMSVGTATAQTIPPSAQSVSPQLRIVDFGQRPDPNTGPPHKIDQRVWPADTTSLTNAVAQWTEHQVAVADTRHANANAGWTADMRDASVHLDSLSSDSANVSITMEGAPAPVSVTVPMNQTVLIGTDRGDDPHPFMAVSFFAPDFAATVPQIFSSNEPGIIAPRKLDGPATIPPPRFAFEHHLRGIAIYFDVDEHGNVVSATPLMGRYPSETDEHAIKEVVRGWRFSPATQNGKPVRATTFLVVNYSPSPR
jgi:hypothetical protein